MKILTIERQNFRLQHLLLCSGDEEFPGCKLWLCIFGFSITLHLPPVLRPYRRRVMARTWSAETIVRMGRDWYWDIHERRYGVSLHDNHLNIYFGRQTHNSESEQSWGCFLPWGEWRFVRFSLYDLDGKHFWTQLGRGNGIRSYEEQRVQEGLVPKVRFKFVDYDGEAIEATTHIEEREWLRGDKWCRWLSFFYSPRVVRSLNIEFSKEVGPRKGSWKGGIIGSSINMLPGELHEGAFARYCLKHKLSEPRTLEAA